MGNSVKSRVVIKTLLLLILLSPLISLLNPRVFAIYAPATCPIREIPQIRRSAYWSDGNGDGKYYFVFETIYAKRVKVEVYGNISEFNINANGQLVDTFEFNYNDPSKLHVERIHGRVTASPPPKFIKIVVKAYDYTDTLRTIREFLSPLYHPSYLNGLMSFINKSWSDTSVKMDYRSPWKAARWVGGYYSRSTRYYTEYFGIIEPMETINHEPVRRYGGRGSILYAATGMHWASSGYFSVPDAVNMYTKWRMEYSSSSRQLKIVEHKTICGYARYVKTQLREHNNINRGYYTFSKWYDNSPVVFRNVSPNSYNTFYVSIYSGGSCITRGQGTFIALGDPGPNYANLDVTSPGRFLSYAYATCPQDPSAPCKIKTANSPAYVLQVYDSHGNKLFTSAQSSYSLNLSVPRGDVYTVIWDGGITLSRITIDLR